MLSLIGIGLFLVAVASAALVRPRSAPADEPFKHLVPGQEYVIARAFRDFKGRDWEVGERWVFKGYTFVPGHDGVGLKTEPGPGVQLQWRAHAQGEIIDNLADYIQPVD